MSHGNHTSKSPLKKSHFMSKLFHRKSKRPASRTPSHQQDESDVDPIKADACDTNFNNHQGTGVTDETDFAGSENEENTHLEQAMLESYHSNQSSIASPSQSLRNTPSVDSNESSMPVASPSPRNTPITPSIYGSTRDVLSLLAFPFYIIYQVLFLLVSFLRVLAMGLSSLAKGSHQVSAPNTRATSLKDNPLIALLIFPVTLIVLMIEAISKFKPRVTSPQAALPVGRPQNPGRDCLQKFFQAFFLHPKPLVASPRFVGRPLSGKPCKCRCKQCVVM